MISIQGLNTSFDEKQIFKDYNLEIPTGTVVAEKQHY